MSTSKTAAELHPQAVSAQELGIHIAKKDVKSESFAIWIRTLLQNWRQGTLGVKGRADVNKTNKKPWKQKGTGRARAGSARSPLWRGGGVTFGPQPRTRVLKFSAQQKRTVLNSLFWTYEENNRICMLDWELAGDVPKTSQAMLALKNAGLAGKKVAVFVPVHDVMTYASFSNLPDVTVVLFDTIQAYTLANNHYWVVCKKDVDAFKDMVTTWV